MLSIKLACFYKLNQRLENFYQLFSRTSVGPSKCRSDKMICSQDHLRIWRVLWVPSVMAKNSITESFLQMNKFWNEALKNVHCLLSKISLHSVTASWSEASSLSPTVQLDFRWTLKCSIDKMIGLQGHLTIWAVSWVQHDIIQRKSRHYNTSFKINKI